MKRALLITTALAVPVLGVWLVPQLMDWKSYKTEARKQIADMTGYDVDLQGDLSVAFLPSPRVYIEDVRVKDPQGTHPDDTVLTLARLDVRLDLWSLLGGRVAVSAVHLDHPAVFLRKDAQGHLNVMTPQIAALMAGDRSAEHQEKSPVSFGSVAVSDGMFSYQDALQKKSYSVQKIHMDFQANALDGPYRFDGSFLYNDQPVEIEAKMGRFDPKAQAASLNAQADVGGLHLTYAGVVSGGEAPEIQGEASVMIGALPEFLQKNGMAVPETLRGSMALTGMIQANAQGASLKEAKLHLADQTFEGALTTRFSPLSVTGDFQGTGVLNLDDLLGSGHGGEGGTFAEGGGGVMVPATLSLPALGPVSVNLSMPTVAYNRHMYKTVALTLQNTDKGFALVFQAGDMPGQGPVALKADLNYAKKAPDPKTGAVVYSHPSVAVSLKGQSRNLPMMVEAVTGLRDLPLIKDTKTGLFDLTGYVTENGGLVLEKGVVNLDQAAYALSGSYKSRGDTARERLTVRILADQMDFDALSGADKGQTPAGGDPLESLKTLALPFDLEADVTVNKATIQGYQVEGFKAAVGVEPNALNISKISARQFAGAAFDLSGRIADLKNIRGVVLKASVKTPDPYKLASALRIPTDGWPRNLGATHADIKAEGDLSRMDTQANVQAMGGTLIFKGLVADPLHAPAVSNVALQVKHPNMAQALKNFGASAPAYGSFSGPVDFYTTVNMQGKVTALAGIKATLAGTNMTGGLRYDASGAVPAVSGDVRFGRLVLQSAGGGGTAAASGTRGVPSTGGGGKWSTIPMDTGWMRAMNAHIAVTAESLLYETWDLRSPSLTVSLQDGALDVRDLKAGVFDGQMALQGRLSSAGAGTPLALQAKTTVTDVNLEQLATALSGSRRIKARGKASLSFDVAGAGASQSALVNTLKGKADLHGQNVVMEGFDLAGLATALMDSNKPLDRLQSVLGASTSGGETVFDTIEGGYTITDGVVHIDSMQMDGPEAMIVSTGNANMPRWTLDTVHTVTLKNAREVAPFKVTIKGPLDNPANTFGKGMFDTLLREKVQDQVAKKLPGLLGDKLGGQLQKFGILPPQKAPSAVPSAPALDPAAGEGTAPSPVSEVPAPMESVPAPESEPATPPADEEPTPEDAINNVLKGLLQ